VFFADQALAESFGTRGAGWYWWSCQSGCLPDNGPHGAFPSSYRAYRDAMAGRIRLFVKELFCEQ